MQAVLVLGGEPLPGDAAWLRGADLVVAADSGLSWLARLGVTPTALVGDLDSVPADLVERASADSVVIERHPADKDASDAELALGWAEAAGATRVVIVGGLGGGRIDHELANLLLLTDPGWSAPLRDLRLVRGGTSVRPLRGDGRLALEGKPGDLVSLLPIGDADGVRTLGLRFELHDEPLAAGRSRGLSNEVLTTGAEVSLRSGTLLVVETPAGEA